MGKGRRETREDGRKLGLQQRRRYVRSDEVKKVNDRRGSFFVRYTIVGDLATQERKKCSEVCSRRRL